MIYNGQPYQIVTDRAWGFAREAVAKVIAAGGTVLHLPGHDYGGPLELVASHGDYHVIKWHGHTDWVALGAQGYHPTEFFLVRGEKDDGKLTVSETIRSVTPGRKYRAALTALVEEARTRARMISRMVGEGES